MWIIPEWNVLACRYGIENDPRQEATRGNSRLFAGHKRGHGVLCGRSSRASHHCCQRRFADHQRFGRYYDDEFTNAFFVNPPKLPLSAIRIRL